jgi:hypothetical protein
LKAWLVHLEDVGGTEPVHPVVDVVAADAFQHLDTLR